MYWWKIKLQHPERWCQFWFSLVWVYLFNRISNGSFKWCSKKPASTLEWNLKVPGSILCSAFREIIHPKTTSYFGIMGDRFDLKLIPEFDGSTSVLDWVEKVELHCLLSGVKGIEHVIPLRLFSGVFAVCQPLSAEEKQNYERNVAPQIMKTIVNAMLSQQETIKEGTSVYLDDIHVNEDVVSSSRVRSKLAEFGLICKDPERLEDGACVLGLNIQQERWTLKWGRRTAVPEVPDVFTGRAVFSLCGKLVGHLQVCGWTRVATGTIKRRASTPTYKRAGVICELESIFYERGPPEEILTDNDTAFCSMEFRRFIDEWGVRLRHRCAYVLSGNSIAERCHRSVKRIAARKACTIAEAVYRYNATPKDAVTAASALANAIHRYWVCIKGIDARLPDWRGTKGPYELGDIVWVKPPNSRCTTSFQRGRITGIISEQAVLVDGTPRHVRDVRPALNTSPLASSGSGESSNDTIYQPLRSGRIWHKVNF